MAAKAIPIEQLLLDEENPRHGPTGSQREAMAAMIRDQGDKLVKLAQDVVKNGVSPIDTLIVVRRRGSNYTVLEGNRRALVVKLLTNPELAQDTELEKDFLKLSKNAKVPKSLDAVIFPNPKAARHWIQLRHDGEAGGADVVRWGAAQRSRFEHRPGSQSARALAFISSARAARHGRGVPNGDRRREPGVVPGQVQDARTDASRERAAPLRGDGDALITVPLVLGCTCTD